MNKLRLELDELAVETFETENRERDERGTVRAHFWAGPGYTQYEWQCYTANVKDATCQAVYTCPECASPPKTYDACGGESADICLVEAS